MKFTKTQFTKETKTGLLHAPISERVDIMDINLKNQFLFFDSAAHFVDCIDDNLKIGNFRSFIENTKQGWRYGAEFGNRKTTTQALINGESPNEIMNMYALIREEIQKNNPELFELAMRAKKSKRRRQFREEGAELNIDRFMTGEVEMWEKSVKVNKKPTVKLLINAAVSASVTSRHLITNIIACVTVVDILNAAGINCEVSYSIITRGALNYSHFTGVFIKLKESNEPCDVSRMLSCVAPGLFRDYGFTAFDNLFLGGVGEAFGNSYGYAASSSEVNTINKVYPFDLTVHIADGLNANINYLISKTNELLS